MKSEHEIQSEIMLAVSARHCTIFRANVGKFKTQDGRWVSTGLPNGYPDLFGFIHGSNKIFFIEVKNATGRPRPDQIRFHKFLQKNKVIHGIARSPEDALKIIDKELVGYGY